jgi:hypothetical protein
LEKDRFGDVTLTFILSKDLPDPDSLLHKEKSQQAWKAYQGHLDTYAARLPPQALEFARADWHYDIGDPRCPHDAWLETVQVEEGADSSPNHEREIRIVLRLLGAQHDGHLEIVYENVRAYSFDMPALRQNSDRRSHGDWLRDEIRSEGHRGRVTHEIEWAGGTRWVIDCGEIRTAWHPRPDRVEGSPESD